MVVVVAVEAAATVSVEEAAAAGRAAAAAAPERHQLEPSELPQGIMGNRLWLLTLAWMTSLPSWRR